MATIIDVEGRAYRGAGAKMLISESGDRIGSITAGCLEAEIRRIADSVRESGHAVVHTFDLMADEDVWGLGMGCNGSYYRPFRTRRSVVRASSVGLRIEHQCSDSHSRIE